MPVPSVEGLIPRAALATSLRAAIAESQLVLVHGPPGYGKTSACALALHAQDVPTAWYCAQLWHEGDFIEPLVSEVRAVRADFGRRTLALATSGRPPSSDSDQLHRWGQRVGATFAQELDNVRQRLVIVIEDFHLLNGDLAFEAFVTGMMRTLPKHVTLVLAGRTPPPLPFALWLAQGRCVMFDSDALKFDAAETAALAHVNGKSLDQVAAAELCQRYDGWGAGLALILRAKSTLLPSPAGPQSAPSAYLIDEHLSKLPPELIAFLEQTAVLETIRPPLLAQHGGVSHALERVQGLLKHGSMIRVVRAGEEYRIHPLLREAVLSSIRARDGEARIQSLHRWAAGMLEAGGRIQAALYHAELAGDDAYLAQFLAKFGSELFDRGLGERAAAAARRIAQGGATSRALSLTLRGMLLRQRAQPGVHELFAEALELAESAGAQESVFAIRGLLLELSLYRLQPPDEAQLRQFLSAARSHGRLQRANALVTAGWADAIAYGDFASARERAREARQLAANDVHERFRAALLDAYASTCLGDVRRANLIIDELVAELEESDYVLLLCMTLSWAARLALLWGDMWAAIDYALQGVRLGRNLNLPSELTVLHLVAAELWSNRGDVKRCVEAAASARKSAASAWYVADRERADARAEQFVARANFCAGDAATALGQVRGALAMPRLGEVQRASMLADATLYATLTRDGEAGGLRSEAFDAIARAKPIDAPDAVALAEAVSLLRLAQSDVVGVDQPRFADLPNAARFNDLLAQRVDFRALRAAGDLMRTARASPPADQEPVIANLIGTYKELVTAGQRFEASALLAVMSAMNKTYEARAGAIRIASSASAKQRSGQAKLSPAHGAPASTLTKRELEVLMLIALGLTNKEIAQRLTLGKRTVDTHVQRVLSKLGASTRTRAVAEASRAGILTDQSFRDPEAELESVAGV